MIEGSYSKGLKETDKHSFQSKSGLSLLLPVSLGLFTSGVSRIRYELQHVCLHPLVLSVVICSRYKGGWVNLILLCYSVLLYSSM